jgi:hypothetical protein
VIFFRRGADKSLAFPIFLFAAQTKEFFLAGLKKLEQRSHKCVELKVEYVEKIHCFNPVACCFLYRAKDLSAPSYSFFISSTYVIKFPFICVLSFFFVF